MTTTDLAVRRDTAVDAPLADQPEPIPVRYVTVVNPHRAGVMYSAVLVLITAAAMVAQTAVGLPFPQVSLGALMAAILVYVYYLARFERFDR